MPDDVLSTIDPASPIEPALETIQRRVLWLATRIVDAANHDRDTGDGVKVGGHQASSASMVSIMTALWFGHLDAEDRVSVKPHASPVLHAINYLLGTLDRSYLTTLRARGGLQSYPSRTKDPDQVDFSTGSVGLGATAPLFAAAVRRYVDAHFGPRPRSRFVSLIGDAELDEGNIWEAIADPVAADLGNVLWVVDFNRQSLDRIVPGVRISQWSAYFTAMGWHAMELKYGRRLRAAFTLDGGESLRRWIDDMANEQYQSLFGLADDELRKRFLDGAPAGVTRFCADFDDAQLAALVTDLGGHDLLGLIDAFAECDRVDDRPSVLFPYTVKGWGLPMAGNPRNHSALLSVEQVEALRASLGLTAATEWDRIDPGTDAGRLVADRAAHLARTPAPDPDPVPVPAATGVRTTRPISTQEAFGRILTDLSRDPAVAPHLVTTAPDVATSTNLAGYINRVGVFAPADRKAWHEDAVLRWTESPAGQHLELGISEMNLFSLLGQLGLADRMSGHRLLPIGTVYDPFVLRGLDAFVYSVYSGSRFVVVGTPSGVTLAPEGGAHQSIGTASVGIELPGVSFAEPAYATALDWLLCDALADVGSGAAPEPDRSRGTSHYLRLTTRPLDQAPFEAVRRRVGDAVLRGRVLAGAYQLLDAGELAATGAPAVNLVATGAVLPETLAAAEELAGEGVAAHVVDVTAAGRLYHAWQQAHRTGVRTARRPSVPEVLRTAFPGPAAAAPVVTVHDASSHALAWLGTALGVPGVPLGVDSFGQSGTVADLYELNDLQTGAIVNAALAALAR